MSPSPELNGEVGTAAIEQGRFAHIRTAAARVIMSALLSVSGAVTYEVLTAEDRPVAAATVDEYPWRYAEKISQPPAADNITWGYRDKATCDNKSAEYNCSPIALEGPWYYKDQWGYDLRNCTSYVAWRVAKEFGVNIPSTWGNAETWDDRAKASGYAVDIGRPEPGDIGVSDGRHVVFVESVNEDESVNGSQFNAGLNGNPSSFKNKRFDHYIDINGEGKSLDGSTGGGGTSPTAKAGEGGGNVASWGVGRLDVFTKGTNATGPNLYHKYFETDKGWSGNGLLSDSTKIRMASQPSAISWGPNRIDVFARSEGNLLVHKWWDGTRWNPWETFAGCIKGTPSVASWGPNRLDIFARNCNSTGPNIMHKWWNGTWKGWETVPNAAGRVASMSVVSPEPNRIDIFGIDQNNNNLLHNWYDNGWKPQESLGGCLTDELAVASWEPDRFDIFAEGCNTSGQNTYHKWFDNGWNDWELLPGANNMQVVKMLGAISWANQRIDVTARASNGEILHKWWNGSWSPWETLGGSVAP